MPVRWKSLPARPPSPPAQGDRPVLLVTLLDLPEHEHELILTSLLPRFQQGHQLVFLLSTDAFTPFLRHAVALETFTPVEQQLQHRQLMDWPGYLAEKWELLLMKWRPVKIISYGSNPERFLARSRAAAMAAASAEASPHATSPAGAPRA